MVRSCTLLVIIAVFGSCSPARAADKPDAASSQHREIGVAESPAAADHPLPPGGRWFPEVGLGLFVHYGLASVGGRQDLSWAMMKDCPWNKHNSGVMTPNDYYAMAERFEAEHFRPDRWLAAAREAGFGYAVMTTRHHEGFALWPSDFGELNTKNHMGGRDLVKAFVRACRANDIKVGFYYSSPDWYMLRKYRSWGYGTKGTADSPHLDMNHQPVDALPPRPADFDRQLADYINGQLTELLTDYGRIDYLWFDGSVRGVMTQPEIRKLQPHILINDRQHGDGNVITRFYEANHMPEQRPPHLWEHCFSMVGAWGYTSPVRCQPINRLTARLARARTWGGNVLANFGPQPDGDMPPEYYACMKELAGWMKWAKPAVVGADPGPYPQQSNVPVTVRGDTWYAFVLPETRDNPASPDRIVLAGVKPPKSVIHLRTGRPLSVRLADDRLLIDLPADARADTVEVIAITWPNTNPKK